MVRSKLPNVGTSIFAVMSDLANKHKALNLSQGFPDFDPPSGLLNMVEKNLRNGFNQYAPMPGLISLREKNCKKNRRTLRPIL
jgi:methionine aminotransferase